MPQIIQLLEAHVDPDVHAFLLDYQTRVVAILGTGRADSEPPASPVGPQGDSSSLLADLDRLKALVLKEDAAGEALSRGVSRESSSTS